MISEWILYIIFYLLSAVFTAFLAYCLYIHHLHQKYDHIPGPPRDNFLFGHSQSLTKAMYSDDSLIHDLFLQWAEKYGPVYRIYSLHYVAIVVHCPEATKTIMMSPKYTKDPFVYRRLFNLFGKRLLWTERALVLLDNLVEKDCLGQVFYTHTPQKLFEVWGDASLRILSYCKKKKKRALDLLVGSTLDLPSKHFIWFLGYGLITAVDHDIWYRQRRIMDPAFSSSYLRSLISTFDEMSERLMDKLEEMANNKTPAVMHDLVNCVTLDVICKVAFGVDLNFLTQTDSPFQNAVELCLNGMTLDLRDPLFRLFPKNWKLIQQIKDATVLLRKTGEKWIQNRKTAVKNGEDVPKDILTQILKSAEEENVNSTDDLEQMLDNFVTFFIAGQETTANQLSFAIMALGRNPEIYKRAKAEVDEVLGTKREISNEDLGKFTYLSQVLKETLRLYPTAPGTNRWLHEDMVINGIKIPGGCSVMFSSYVSQRLEKFFKDPLKFDPERFDVNAPKPFYCYFPFALGPRTCLGQVFSQMEAKVVLAKLLQRFEFSLVPGQSFDIKDTGTLRPKSGVICNIKQCS